MAAGTDSRISRRHLLRLGALTGAGVAVLASARAKPAAAGPVYCNPERPASPADALEALMDGNERWATDHQIHPGEDEDRRECNAHYPQTPFAALLACLDSRVPPELIFDQGIGDLFPSRIAGNSVVPILEDSLGRPKNEEWRYKVDEGRETPYQTQEAILSDGTKAAVPLAKIPSAGDFCISYGD